MTLIWILQAAINATTLLILLRVLRQQRRTERQLDDLENRPRRTGQGHAVFPFSRGAP